MKYWAFTITLSLLGTFTPLAYAGPQISGKNSKLPAYQEKGARDVSQNAWSSWEAPVSTVDPSQLVSDDSTDPNTPDGLPARQLDSPKADSFELVGAFNDDTAVKVEEAKSIQKVESSNLKSSTTQPAPAVAVVAPKSSSNRILWIAVISVAVLGYRKFRRANAGRYPKKPSFL